MRQLLVVGLLALLPTIAPAADPTAEWKLPEADGERWVARVKKAVSRKDWTVERHGNEITIQRTKPVAMARIPAPNGPLGSKDVDKPTPAGEQTVRFVLRFAPKMTADEYDKLAEVNAASDKEHDRLRENVGLAHKFDDFIATTPEQKKRLADYNAAVAKLPRHALPHLYTPDHSIFLLHPWDGWSFPADKETSAECHAVEEKLLRLFGVYSPDAVARGGNVGEYLR